jgi:hypothetical protein
MVPVELALEVSLNSIPASVPNSESVVVGHQFGYVGRPT